jgi:Tfp pilus assembly protein PilN
MKPRALDLDFARALPQRPRVGRVLLVFGTIVVAGGALLCTRGWAARVEAGMSLAAWHARQTQASGARRAPSDPHEAARRREVARVAQGLQVPWADLLGALEAASGESVALLTVEPSTQQQTVRLTAEARDPHSMLRYLSTLQGDARLSQVVLVSHAVQTQAPGTPVRFQLQAHWGAQP